MVFKTVLEKVEIEITETQKKKYPLSNMNLKEGLTQI